MWKKNRKKLENLEKRKWKLTNLQQHHLPATTQTTITTNEITLSAQQQGQQQQHPGKATVTGH
jgi:hypothetical protein